MKCTQIAAQIQRISGVLASRVRFMEGGTRVGRVLAKNLRPTLREG
jgi:hypothetical protein